MIHIKEILQERLNNIDNSSGQAPLLFKNKDNSPQKIQKLKKAQSLKAQVADQLKSTLKSLTNEMNSIDDHKYQRIFQSWVDQNGVSNYLLKWIEKDRSAWNRINEGKMKESVGLEKYRVIHQKIDSNTNKQNCNYFNFNRNLALDFHNQQRVIPERKKERSQDNLIQEENEEEEKQKQKQNPFKKRGPYKNYSEELKKQVVDLYLSGTFSLNKIYKQYGIPIKNIKRWAENGIYRKAGAGRKKLDPEMEETVYERIINSIEEGSVLKESKIREWALEECRVGGFKASRGWINKFIQRHKLNERYVIG